ncbi:MAG: hypothetical protein FJX25_10295 [Alphaproteobacteria bacterium]|nr:hypothetical protein [Alphaproteobacteria bacterium]
MSILWQQAYPSGRILAKSGRVEIRAVFPPIGEGQHRFPWVWRLWINGKTCATEGRAKTELAAKSALLSAWRDFLSAADLAYMRSQKVTDLEAQA